MSVPNNMETGVWLLMGLTGSTQGVLEMKDSMISFTAYGQGALTNGQLEKLATSLGDDSIIRDLQNNKPVILFNCPVQHVEQINFPWYTFGGGMNLKIKGVMFRFSLLQPQNTVSGTSGKKMSQIAGNISEGRKLRQQWYDALKEHIA